MKSVKNLFNSCSYWTADPPLNSSHQAELAEETHLSGNPGAFWGTHHKLWVTAHCQPLLSSYPCPRMVQMLHDSKFSTPSSHTTNSNAHQTPMDLSGPSFSLPIYATLHTSSLGFLVNPAPWPQSLLCRVSFCSRAWVLLPCQSPFVHPTMNVPAFHSLGTAPNTT